MSGYLVQFLTGFAQLGIIGVTTLFEQVEILLCHLPCNRSRVGVVTVQDFMENWPGSGGVNRSHHVDD